VKTRDGRILQERVDTAKGSAKNPMSTEEVIRKYEILAGKVLPPKRVTELKETVFRLERVDHIRELARLLVPASER
jgi:2-methylcitrate dehydratase PrpD